MKDRIIRVNNIILVEKDIIEIADRESFDIIRDKFFDNNIIFDLKGKLYLIGSEIAYTYQQQLNEVQNEKKG